MSDSDSTFIFGDSDFDPSLLYSGMFWRSISDSDLSFIFADSESESSKGLKSECSDCSNIASSSNDLSSNGLFSLFIISSNSKLRVLKYSSRSAINSDLLFKLISTSLLKPWDISLS